MLEEEKIQKIAMIHGSIDSKCYHSRFSNSNLKDSSSNIDFAVDKIISKHKNKFGDNKKSDNKISWKRIVTILLIGFLLIAGLQYLLPPLFGDFESDLRVKLSPKDGVYLNETLVVNMTIPSSYNITKVSADMASVETIEMLFVDNDSTLQYWQGVWFVHSLSSGEYIINISALDNINTSYRVGVRLSILPEFQPQFENISTNDTIFPDINETFPPDNQTQIPGNNESIPYNGNDTIPTNQNDTQIPGSNDTLPPDVNDTILPEINESLPPQITNYTNVSIVNPQVREEVYVVPGSDFYVERTIVGRDGIQAVIAPLFSEGLSIEKFEIVKGNVTIGRSRQKVNKLSFNEFVSNNGYSGVERRIDRLRKNLPSDAKELESVGYSGGFVLHEPVTIRIWFRAPSWEDIITGKVPSSGRISYLTFAGNDYDYESSTWWNASWGYRKLISINSSQVKENLVNFPVLINITDTDLQNKAQSDGDDIAFVLWSDNSTKLNHEIDNYNSSNGNLFVWVNITKLSSTENTKIWMYYGNSGCSSQEDIPNTWDSNYIGVWHMSQDPDDGSWENITDSTFKHNATASAGMTSSNFMTGKISKCYDYDGTDNTYLWVNDTNTLELQLNDFTLEAWVYSEGSGGHAVVLSKGDWIDATTTNMWLWYCPDGQRLTYIGPHMSDYNNDNSLRDTTNIENDQTWYYMTVTRDGDDGHHYTNGALIETETGYFTGNPAFSNDYHLGIGVRQVIGGSPPPAGQVERQWRGRIDEVRISKIKRNESWIETCYNNQNNQSTFVSLGQEGKPYPQLSNPVPPDVSTDISLSLKSLNITINHPGGENMNITWKTNASGSWEIFNITNGGGVGVGNGTYVAINTSWIESVSTTYWWSVNVSDGQHWTNETYYFTTTANPVITNPNPANDGFSIISPVCSVKVSDSDGGTVTVRFYENTTGSWVLQQTNNNIDVSAPTTVNWENYNNASGFDTTYWWMVNVSDGKGGFIEEIYNFTTSTDNPPVLNNENPPDLSKGHYSSLNLINVTIEDPEGDSMDWAIQTSPNIGSNSGSGVGNGSITCSISGLLGDTTYTWYVNITDGILSTNESYQFNTSVSPSITLITPSPNGTTDITIQPWCSIWANDTDSGLLNVTWATNASGSWTNTYTNISVSANSSVSYKFTQFDNYSKIYYWKVYVDDTLSNISDVFYFTTELIATSVNLISPYNVTTSTFTIDATGPSNLDNITLYYTWSTDNSSWWNISWPYRIKLTIDSSQVSNNLKNFPILINITDANLSTKAQNDGDDIVFIDSAGNKLNHEIEKYVSGTGSLFAWVNVTTLSSTSDTNVYMYYGNIDCDSQENIPDTWESSFVGVWHFAQDPGPGGWEEIIDSTYTMNGTADSDFTSADLVSGMIGNSYYYDGSSDNNHIRINDTGNIYDFGTDDFTLECWWYNTGSTGAHQSLIAKGTWDDPGDYLLYVPTTSGGQISLAIAGDWQTNVYGSNFYGGNWWEYTVALRDGNAAHLYRNGSFAINTSDHFSGVTIGNDNQVGIGAREDGTDRPWLGRIDEVRISHYQRNSSWIETTYNTIRNSSTFITVGNEEKWMMWDNIIENPDTSSPWSWIFDFPNITGYYQFYSIGKKSGSVDEIAPYKADFACYCYINTTISINPNNWDIGSTTVGNYNYSTTGFYFNFTNNGTVILNVQIKASNATNSTTGAEWNLSSSPGLDNYSLQYNKSGIGIWTNINQTYDTFIINLGVGSWQTFDLNILMATTSTKSDPLTVTITFRSIVA
jgi:hypothetical protein